jgi:CO/xanthine dehydrogenase Mo-binding subunit
VILNLGEAPHEGVVIVHRRDQPSREGEVSVGPTAAAIGNAQYDALGARVGDMPLAPQQIIAAMDN